MMHPHNVSSLILYGENQDYVLFKCAFHYAELGLKIWFVSPESINDIPANISTPSRDVLKLITFLYLKDSKDLLHHLNSIHIWHKIPNVIILRGLETYGLLHSDYCPTKTALLMASLLDAASTCGTKQSNNALLLVNCHIKQTQTENQLQVLNELYFKYTFKAETFQSQNDIVNKICEVLKC